MRKSIFVLTACLVLSGGVRAQEPRLPANMKTPITAYARFAQGPGGGSVFLRMVNTIAVPEKKTVTEYVAKTRDVGGRTEIVTVPVTKEVMQYVQKPMGWREVEIKTITQGFSAHDTAGKAVAKTKLATLLAEETPVLVSTEGPIDPFHLLTAKEGTLVLVTPAMLLAQPMLPKTPQDGKRTAVPRIID
jgi:hypothetical protein